MGLLTLRVRWQERDGNSTVVGLGGMRQPVRKRADRKGGRGSRRRQQSMEAGSARAPRSVSPSLACASGAATDSAATSSHLSDRGAMAASRFVKLRGNLHGTAERWRDSNIVATLTAEQTIQGQWKPGVRLAVCE